MKISFPIGNFLLLIIEVCGSANASPIPVTWFAPTAASNSNVNVSTSPAYTSNLGVAFTTGATASSYTIDWASLGFNSSSLSNTSASVKLSLRNTTNSTAYSAVAGATEYAVDTVNFVLPSTTATKFTLDLDASLIPNIAAYAMQPNTAYSLIIYNASVAFGMERKTGYAQNTTNNFYTVGEEFTALNTFRNNTTYTNNVNSYPTLDISFGRMDASTIPEPSVLSLVVSIIPGWWLLRRRQSKS